MSETIAIGFAWYVVFILSTCLHEAAHALVAFKLGDPTAYHGGQVTLDPRPHIRREPFGTVLMPIISYFFMGWMIGWASAPYDPYWAQRHPRRAALMALAGPASNLILVVLAGLLIRLGLLVGIFRAPRFEEFGLTAITVATGQGAVQGLAVVASILFLLNLVLFLFNLLPLPPLDGSGALPLILPERIARRYLDIMRQPMFSILGIVIAWKLFGTVFTPVWLFALRLLYPER